MTTTSIDDHLGGLDTPPATAGAVRCDAVTSESDLDDVRRLWQEFRAWLADRYSGDDRWLVEAYFDDTAWDRELSSLPGQYEPAHGGDLLVARIDERAVGTVAVRAVDALPAGRCEMKRLYVSHAGRRCGIGDRLVEAVTERARQLGYSEMVLDTGFRQHEATQLYLKHGFVITGPHYGVDARLASGGLTFMRKRLVQRHRDW